MRGLLIGGGKRSLCRKGFEKGPGKWRENDGSAVGCCTAPGKSATGWNDGGAPGLRSLCEERVLGSLIRAIIKQGRSVFPFFLEKNAIFY